MQTLELDHKNDERMRAIQKFTLMDDTFMTQVFAGDTECTQELLHIILHRAGFKGHTGGNTADHRKFVWPVGKAGHLCSR